MKWVETPLEQRHAMRLREHGSVRLRCGGRQILGRIHDLSTTGLSIRTDAQFGLAGLMGCDVTIDLKLDDGRTKWLALRGHVLRTSIANKMIAIEIDEAPSDFEDCIQDHLLSAIEHHSLPPPRRDVTRHP